jgi:hypothetical protein
VLGGNDQDVYAGFIEESIKKGGVEGQRGKRKRRWSVHGISPYE